MTKATPKFDPSAPQHIAVRVYYEDTDAEGVVYYANYLRFAERGRTEFLRSLGYDLHQVRKDYNLLLVVRRAEIDYLASARLDDLLDIQTEIAEVRNASLTMKQIVSCNGKIYAQINVVLVAVSQLGKPTRIPPQLRQIFGQ